MNTRAFRRFVIKQLKRKEVNKMKGKQKNTRKKLTENIIQDILAGNLIIWIWVQVEGQDELMQFAFPGKPTLHRCYLSRNSYFECPNASDKFYFKEFDYFWFVTSSKPPKDPKEEQKKLERNIKIMDEAIDNPEAIPGSGSKFN